MKGRAYFAFTALGIVTFGSASFSVGSLAPRFISAPTALTMQSVLASICASFIFLFATDAGHHLREALYRRRFRHFFGELSVSSTSHLVYPDFVLSEECQRVLKTLPSTKLFRKQADQYPGSRFIDVPRIVASNDLQGIVIIATKLGKYLGDSPHLITDGQAVNDPSKSFISFGLTSNSVTDLYQNTDSAPLFTIEDPDGDPKIVIQRYGQTERFGRTEQYQHGVILRYRPNPQDYPTTFWFICAGLAAAGTPAAAWNLAHKWDQYERRFGEADFLIIFRTSNDVHAYGSYSEVCAISR